MKMGSDWPVMAIWRQQRIGGYMGVSQDQTILIQTTGCPVNGLLLRVEIGM
jgi:hypothetical protein